MFSPAPYSSASSRRGTRNLSLPKVRSPSRRSYVSSNFSRLSTPTPQPGLAADVRSDATSEMEVDADAGPSKVGKQKGTVIFAQSPELTVTLLAQLPEEVQQALRNADFARDAFSGDVDTNTNHCFIASTNTCFVWNHSQSLLGAPTCFIFPCPRDLPATNPPFGALVSYGPSREPGLLLLSPGGSVRFWDSIGLGLTGGDHTDASSIELDSGEFISVLISAQPQTFVAATTQGRLFLLAISSTLGKFHVTHRTFTLTRPQYGALSVLKFWGTQAPPYVGGNTTAATTRVSAQDIDAFEVYTCTDTNIVRWTVKKEGWEQFESEVNIEALVTLRVVNERPHSTPGDGNGIDLELDDIAFDGNGNLVLLISYAGLGDESDIDNRPRRVYAVSRLRQNDESYSIISMHFVPYQTISADKANIQPRLRLLERGSVYCVQFGDAVALVARDSTYSNILTLKSLQDRTFGCGVIADSPEMLFMNSEVLMKVDVDLERVRDFNADTGRGLSIKSIMTQAILYGSNPKNPLLFSFAPDVDEESLIAGAEQLSRAVLTSENEVVRPNPDLTLQILERKDRLRFLIGFINENGVLGKMSQASRQRLAIDAELLFTVQQLWNYYCARVNAGMSERLLPSAIQAYMEETGEGYHEDTMRAFFRLQTRDLGSLLPYVVQFANETMTSWSSLQHIPDVLPRCITIFLTTLQSAWNYRDTNAGVYGLSGPMLRAWTSTSVVVDLAEELFAKAERALHEAEPGDDDTLRRDLIARAVKELFAPLAAVVFRCFQERMEWLDSPAAAEEPGIESEKREFRDRFTQLRPVILQALLKHDLADSSFSLAEEYHDFRSLVELCYSTSPVYPPASNSNAGRIEAYIEKYKEEFTDELFQWCIEQAELRTLFALSDVYGDYADAFFAKHPHPSLSWIHDLGKHRWDTASLTLLADAIRTPDLAVRHLILSIGKLSQLTHISVTDRGPNSMDAFHNALDYVSVHHKLVEDLREALGGSRARQSLENQVDNVAKATAKRLKSYPAFASLYRSCVRNLLQGRVLAIEDMIDVLTLKDDASDHAIALELLKDDTKDIPEARRHSACRTVWRRIYIHDDWRQIRQTAKMTDVQLIARFKKTSLFSTVRDALENASTRGMDAQTLPLHEAAQTLPLHEAALVPTEEELASRWPGHSVEQIADLVRDYRAEAARLQELDLEPIVERVKELAAQEVGL